MFCHDLYKLFVAGLLRVPAEDCSGFGRIAPEIVDIGRTVPLWIRADKELSGLRIIGFLVDPFAFPAKTDAVRAESLVGEVLHGMLLAGCYDKVFGFFLLHD